MEALIEELASYPAPAPEPGDNPDPGADSTLGPVGLRAPDGSELSFLAMFAGFDNPFEVTTSELAIELLFPADRATADALRALVPGKGGTVGGSDSHENP